MAQAAKPKLGGTLIDLGGFTVELKDQPLAFANAFRLEALIKASYPTIVCVFNKQSAYIKLTEISTCKRWFNKRYKLMVENLKGEGDQNAKLSGIIALLETHIENYNNIAQAGGSIVKLLLMPAALHDQYIYRYLDLEGGIKTKKKAAAWIALKLATSSGAVIALVLGILGMV